MFNKTKEKIAAVQAIPDQVRLTVVLAVSAFVIALIAMTMSLVVRNAS